MKKQLFIRGDLNALQDNVIPLRNDIWIQALRREHGKITDGLNIWLFELTIKNGKYDPTVFPGTIRDIGKEDEYEILVNDKEMKYLSESEKFKGYDLKDIIGEEWFSTIKKEHPELLS